MDKLVALLESLLYKTVTIYVHHYGQTPLFYCGTIMKVHATYLSLIIYTGNRIDVSDSKEPINFNRRFHPKVFYHQLGTIVDIPINKIEAIQYYS